MKKYSYHGNRKPYAAVLCHSADMETAEPVLAEIEKQGLRLCLVDENAGKAVSRLKKACGVICVLTENFSGSENLQSGILEAEAAGKSVIPVRTDGFDLPDFIKRMTYASNSVNISKYTPEKAAERILTAPALAGPKLTKEQNGAFRRAAALIAVAAVVIAAAVAVPLLRDRTTEPEEHETAGETVIDLPDNWDLTAEDLAKVTSIVLTGDKVEEADNNSSVYDFLNQNWDRGYCVWYRLEDGSEVEKGSITDFSFLTQFPNLETLILVNQSAETLPDLSGLPYLHRVDLIDCAFTDLEGLRNSSVMNVHINRVRITDVSPLTDCRSLSRVSIQECEELRSLDGFRPPRLTELVLSGPLDDLNALSGLDTLTKLDLFFNGRNTPLDLSPLAGCRVVSSLHIEADKNILDFSAISAMKQLDNFDCRCFGAMNTAAAGQPFLKNFSLECGDGKKVDLSFLSGCPELDSIELIDVNTDLDFFKDFPGDYIFSVVLDGRNIDYTGLSAMKSVYELEICTGNTDVSAALNALGNTKVNTLRLRECSGIDLSVLPDNITNLELADCRLTDLTGLTGAEYQKLSLSDLSRLTSLNGIEDSGLSILSVSGCPRLTNWSAAYGLPLQKLEIRSQFMMPDFGSLNYQSPFTLWLENTGLTDLNCLDAISDDVLSATSFNVCAAGYELTDLSALRRFNPAAGGEKTNAKLTVFPVAEAAARELVASGNFARVEIQYPDGDWEDVYSNYAVLSFEELNSLPDTVLARIRQLWVIGDEFYEDGGWCEAEERNGRTEYYFSPADSDERIRVAAQGPVKDLSVLSKMTGLERMILMCQPLDSLDGIQNLAALRELTIYGCPNITDYSPVFALGSLEQLRLEGKNVTSVEGIQNLYSLKSLDLGQTRVTDLSPIGEMNFSEAVRAEGFSLTLPDIDGLADADFSFLSAVPRYSRLEFFARIGDGWMDCLQGIEVREAHLYCGRTESLEKFVSAVSGLEYLKISWQEGIDDLTCLPDCDSLRTVVISSSMKAAIKSLEGTDYGFELEYDG